MPKKCSVIKKLTDIDTWQAGFHHQVFGSLVMNSPRAETSVKLMYLIQHTSVVDYVMTFFYTKS